MKRKVPRPEMAAYAAGWEARAQRRSHLDNPFWPGWPGHEEWLRGWVGQQAEQDRREREGLTDPSQGG